MTLTGYFRQPEIDFHYGLPITFEVEVTEEQVDRFLSSNNTVWSVKDFLRNEIKKLKAERRYGEFERFEIIVN